MNSRDLIIICVTIILLLSIGIFMVFNSNGGSGLDFNPNAEVTILNMTSSPYLNEGDSLKLSLVDENKTPIPNQKIEINLTDKKKGITENYTLKTNSKGECKLEDLIAGNFSFIAKYYGNSEYKESSISSEITVNKNVSTENAKKTNSVTDYKVDDVINGWDPSEHEVSREDLGDGCTRINYDDGYFRIIDSDGNILTYGYWFNRYLYSFFIKSKGFFYLFY